MACITLLKALALNPDKTFKDILKEAYDNVTSYLLYEAGRATLDLHFQVNSPEEARVLLEMATSSRTAPSSTTNSSEAFSKIPRMLTWPAYAYKTKLA